MNKQEMLLENTYIMNLEAAYIYKDIQEDREISSKEKDYNKLFSATIPYSLETIRMSQMFSGVFYIHNKKQCTKKIVNLTFDKNYTEWDKKNNKRKIIASKNKIRGFLYKNGFVMDGEKYVFYKRGAGKAKNGYAFFIQENMKEPLLKRSRLNLEFKNNEKLDLTSLLAYESLISSNIISTINLNPKEEILLIKDIDGIEFKTTASVTREEDGQVVTGNERISLKNCLTDGQGLLDVSVFEDYEKSDKGFMLLRSDMFKCCAFNTNLQKWFEDNKVITLKDMFGNEYDAKKIKLVTTPNSLKFLKFAYKIGEGSEDECYQYWINNVDSTFGVVKYDSKGNYGNYNRSTYQLLNSIPNLTYSDLMEITKDEREYVDLLKNNEAVFRNYILRDSELSYMMEERMESGDVSPYEAMDSMYCLFLVNSDIQYTSKFKEIKSKLIANYINDLKMGKIRMKDTKYTTLVSNPYEMLLATIGKYDGSSIMKGREVYCPYYSDGQEFCISRNPHINAGNVMHSKNRYHEEYREWFNFTSEICVINFFDNDAPDRLQGCDTDSDTVLMIPNKILSERAKSCEQNYPTPINRVEGTSIPRRYNMKELRKLDSILSNNYIGKIVNMSQIINSYMNDAIYKGETEDIIDELYQASSKLSSLSQIEIDKSKKVFDNVNMYEELNSIRGIKSIRHNKGVDRFGNEVDKMVVPNFFSMISDSNEYRILEKFNTPLDILQGVLEFGRGKKTQNKEFKDLLIKPSEVCIFNSYQIKPIWKIVSIYGKKVNGLMLKTCTLNEKAKSTVRRNEKEKALNELRKLKITTGTILNILRRCFKETKDEYGFSKYAMVCLNLLLETNRLDVLKCFKNKKISDNIILIESNTEMNHNIFGVKYSEVSIETLKNTKFFKKTRKINRYTH